LEKKNSTAGILLKSKKRISRLLFALLKKSYPTLMLLITELSAPKNPIVLNILLS
jgi:hypothetical protein